jgi:HSP20 family protein
MSGRLGLSDLGLETGKLARLHRILDRRGLANGTALFLRCDQGLEHGPRDFEGHGRVFRRLLRLLAAQPRVDLPRGSFAVAHPCCHRALGGHHVPARDHARAASVAANRSVTSEWDDPSTPTTTSVASGADGGRTTATGQRAFVATCSATEPSRRPATPSSPRVTIVSPGLSGQLVRPFASAAGRVFRCRLEACEVDDEEAIDVASLVRRDRPVFAELFDWLEGEIPPMFRPLGGGHPVRIEDFIEEGGRYVLRAELPGVDPAKDVMVTVADGVLTVKAERRDETKEEHRSEFRYGAFVRTIALPAGADENDVTATYADGILEVRIGMREGKPEPKQIPVKTS